jgi:toxin FitB
LSVVTIGKLRKGVERIRQRGDSAQASTLARWLSNVSSTYAHFIPTFDEAIAQIWGRLCARHPENPLDKQIAATALIHDLIVVTRNVDHFKPTGVGVLNPFLS